jgi:hypothetical protein
MAAMASWFRVAPAFLDPILALVERIDRRVRRLRPIRRGGLLWLEARRHRGAPVVLGDGTPVAPGDALGIIHFDNRRLRDLAAGAWPTEAYEIARGDLRVLARWHAARPAASRPVAYCGVTLLSALTRRVGFEIHERRPSLGARIEDWYLRSILVRWSPAGRARLERGHGALIAREAWMSGPELERRFAEAAAQ